MFAGQHEWLAFCFSFYVPTKHMAIKLSMICAWLFVCRPTTRVAGRVPPVELVLCVWYKACVKPCQAFVSLYVFGTKPVSILVKPLSRSMCLVQSLCQALSSLCLAVCVRYTACVKPCQAFVSLYVFVTQPVPSLVKPLSRSMCSVLSLCQALSSLCLALCVWYKACVKPCQTCVSLYVFGTKPLSSRVKLCQAVSRLVSRSMCSVPSLGQALTIVCQAFVKPVPTLVKPLSTLCDAKSIYLIAIDPRYFAVWRHITPPFLV